MSETMPEYNDLDKPLNLPEPDVEGKTWDNVGNHEKPAERFLNEGPLEPKLEASVGEPLPLDKSQIGLPEEGIGNSYEDRTKEAMAKFLAQKSK